MRKDDEKGKGYTMLEGKLMKFEYYKGIKIIAWVQNIRKRV